MIGIAGTILQLLDLFVAGTMTYERIQQLRADLAAMQAEGRDPTAEELTAILDGIEASTADIVAADDRLNP